MGQYRVFHLLTPRIRNENTPKSIFYSPNGKYIASIYDSRVEVKDAVTLKVVSNKEVPGLVEAAFSPMGNYLSTWVRFVKGDENAEPHKNLCVWETLSGELVTSYCQKSQNGWNVQWTASESRLARNVTGELHFCDPLAVRAGESAYTKLRVENLASFALSPNKVGKQSVAVFVAEKKGAPASVKLFDIEKLEGKPLAQRSFFNSDYVDFHWNKDGSAVLIQTHAEVDKTGQSYYGKSSLHYLSATGTHESQVGVGEGPVHSVDWSPNSKEFVVVHGSMPSKATMFDHRAEVIYEFPTASRNLVKYSPHGRFVVIAGFGNIPGHIDVWDRMTFTKLADCHAGTFSQLDWAPDGRYILTATLYRRLKVDNGIRFWHYTGVLAHKVDVKEMYQVGWRYEDCERWPKRKGLTPPPTPTAQAEVAPAQPKGVYRPPGARGKEAPAIFSQRDQLFGSSSSSSSPTSRNSVPGAGPANEAGEGKRSKNAKKKGGNAAPAAAAPLAPPVFVPTDDAAKTAEVDKRLKALNKKLKSIKEIKEKRDAGLVLELTQLQKLETEAAVVKEIEELGGKIRD
ncbi:hypothetical protein HK101_001453 [Irineochytrium annulatum]|nr:hypothetical protein HK101_001453 [Irineochytrium annulatum]